MEKIPSDNFGILNKNSDDYLGSMRSSRINAKTTFDYEYTATQTKNQLYNHSKFNSNNNFLDTACSTKRLIFTPMKKQKIPDNESKHTVINSNNFCHFNKFNNPFNLTTCHKMDNEESNKENSNIKSNLFTSQSPLSDKEELDSNSSSGFKMPLKKLEFSNNLRAGKYESVRMNLQKTFNNDSCLFSKTKQDQNQFSHPLISSSESSSQDNTFISKIENNFSNEKEMIIENIGDIKRTCSQESQNSITESLLEGLKKKAVFNIPRERTNDEKYKILALKKIRKSTHKDNKSTSKIDVPMQINNDGRDDSCPESMMQCNLFNKRRKIVHSVKKIYASEIALVNPLSFETKKFRIFKDSDIGINEDWQKYLRESKADEDVPTDDELLNNATAFVHNSLLESFTYLYNNRDSNMSMVNNVCYMNK